MKLIKTVILNKVLDKLTLNLLPIEENLSLYFTKIIVTYKGYKSPFSN